MTLRPMASRTAPRIRRVESGGRGPSPPRGAVPRAPPPAGSQAARTARYAVASLALAPERHSQTLQQKLPHPPWFPAFGTEVQGLLGSLSAEVAVPVAISYSEQSILQWPVGGESVRLKRTTTPAGSLSLFGSRSTKAQLTSCCVTRPGQAVICEARYALPRALDCGVQ